MNSQRLDRLNDVMMNLGLGGVLITKRENCIYFSGFNGSNGYLLITPERRVLITDSRYLIQAENQTEGFEIIEYKDSLIETLKMQVNSCNFKVLGFENEYMSCASYNKYSQSLIGVEFIGLGMVIDELRTIKDEIEIKKIQRAVSLGDKAFEHVLGYIKEGVREIEIAAEIEYFLKKNGATSTSFETIVASGKRGALPHGVASEKKLKKGEAITLDFGAVLDDYCSDMTRTVFLGKPEVKVEEVYKIVKKAQAEASLALFKGMTAKEVDSIARDIISATKYKDYFSHGLGHGVGLEVHEAPTISNKKDTILENGMVVTIEPGIYVPELGGVRIEDMVVVNDKTPNVLTSSTKEMIVL